MPVKVRASKRRASREPGLEEWAMSFQSGFDYFEELRPFGLETTEQVREAMPAAWNRLGRAFLEEQGPSCDPVPYALRAYGDPNQCR